MSGSSVCGVSEGEQICRQPPKVEVGGEKRRVDLSETRVRFSWVCMYFKKRYLWRVMQDSQIFVSEDDS